MMVSEDIAPKLIKKAFRMFFTDVGYVALYSIPVFVGLLAISHVWFTLSHYVGSCFLPSLSSPGPIFYITYEPLIVGIWILIVAICLVLSGIAVVIKVNSEEEGQSITASEALRKSFSYLITVIGASIISVLAVASPILVGVILFFIGSKMLIPIFIIIGLFVMPITLIPALYISLRLTLYLQASVIDNLHAVECVKKSWHVTKGHLLLIFIVMVIFFAISIPFGVVGQFLPSIGTLLSLFIVGPISAITWTLLYRELTSEAGASMAGTSIESIEVGH